MVKYSADLDATFSALADPTRRAILARLAYGESSVTELARPFDISLVAVSKHLRVLERAGLVGREREGRVHRIQLAAEPLRDAADWIVRYRKFWEERLAALDRYLREIQGEETQPWRRERRKRHRRSRSRAPSRPRARKSSGPGRTRRS